MTQELVLAVVVFIVLGGFIVGLALLGSMDPRDRGPAKGGDGAVFVPGVMFADTTSRSDCGGADGGSCDGSGGGA